MTLVYLLIFTLVSSAAAYYVVTKGYQDSYNIGYYSAADK